MASWTFVLANHDFIPLGEILNMQERKVNVPLNALDTCTFKVLADNPHAADIMRCDGYVKGYRDGVLNYVGPIIGAEKVVENGKGTISVNSSSQGWILGKRLILPDTTNEEKHTNTSAVDRAVRFQDFLEYERYSWDVEETVPRMQTGDNCINVYAASAASTAVYNVTEPKFLSVILAELSAGDGGFDWRFLPKENYIDGEVVYEQTAFAATDISVSWSHSVIASFYAAPTIGQLREEAIFEYGTGKHNITNYKQAVTREGQATLVHHYSVGQTPTIVSSEDGFWNFFATEPEHLALLRWRILEDLAEADITDLDLRTQLVTDHVDIRKNPRSTIDFTPIGSYDSARVPQYGVDFGVGDIVRARAVNDFDNLFRVWGVSFDIDNNGVEKMTLSLSEQGT